MRVIGIAAAAAALLLLPAVPAVAAQPAAPVRVLSMPSQGSTVSVAQPVAFQIEYRPGSQVSITWGDGTTWRSPKCATVKRAKKAKPCFANPVHGYAQAGVFTAQVTGTALTPVSATVTVAAASQPATDGHAGAATLPISAVDTVADQAWAAEMLAAVNDVRAKAGVAVLRLCSPLNRAGQYYSDFMSANRWFNHAAPDGTTVTDRAASAGYDGQAWGENIAWGQKTVADVVAAWVKSPSHYANLVDPTFTHVGFGRSGAAPSTYWVQEFAAGGRC